MKIWTYNRRFVWQGIPWRMEATCTFTTVTFRVFRDESIVDEKVIGITNGLETVSHEIPLKDNDGFKLLTIKAGYVNLFSLGIQVWVDDEIVHESHPGKDIHYGAKKFGPKPTKPNALKVNKERQLQWSRNKYSILADIGLGLIFYAVAKFTDDISLAALVGAGAGLLLVAAQKFVKVDLLGGFAVFGTVMLLISAGFSLAFQSEFMVQMKSTILGIVTAVLFIGDGLLQNGRYFGVRMERYLSGKIDTRRMAIGLGLSGVTLALINWLVASFFSKQLWLNYTTFIDTPLSLILFFSVYIVSKKSNEESRMSESLKQ